MNMETKELLQEILKEVREINEKLEKPKSLHKPTKDLLDIK